MRCTRLEGGPRLRNLRGAAYRLKSNQRLPNNFSTKRSNSDGFMASTPKSAFDLLPRLTSVSRSWGRLSFGNSVVTALSACIVLSFLEVGESWAAKYGPKASGGVQEFTASPRRRFTSLISDTMLSRWLNYVRGSTPRTAASSDKNGGNRQRASGAPSRSAAVSFSMQ